MFCHPDLFLLEFVLLLSLLINVPCDKLTFFHLLPITLFRWLDRCVSAHSRPKEQNLFAIVQGGLDLELRKKCAEEMVKRDMPGYAIGGLSGGEAKDDFWKMVG